MNCYIIFLLTTFILILGSHHLSAVIIYLFLLLSLRISILIDLISEFVPVNIIF
jgi:hypothetical protein